MRFAALSLSLAAGFAVAYPAGSVLKHYDVRWTTIREFNTSGLIVVPPSYQAGGPPPELLYPQLQSKAIVGDDSGSAPILRSLLLVEGFQITLNVVNLGPIFFSRRFEQGPGMGLAFTGTGDTDTAITWGLVTGWTVTGGFWCNSSPSYVCTYAQGKDLTTVDPQLYSTHYDLGTWTFHGTGFTAVPFVHDKDAFPSTVGVGNRQYQLKGRLAAGLVPALPVLGAALLFASLLLAGARLSRRR